jgi:tripartite-type tricarboxylate transporter receptor subunit TctC
MAVHSRRMAVALVTALCGFPAVASADTYPTKPVRIVLGLGSDLVPRLLAQNLNTAWGQSVIVDQRPGGNGTIATDIVAKSAPDGYNWLVTAAGQTISAGFNPGVPSRLDTEFSSVTMMVSAPYFVLVHPTVPVKSIAELIDLARTKPKQLTYATSGVGTAPHMATVLFSTMARIDLVHVPYKSSAIGMNDLLGGHVQMSFQFAPAAIPHVKSNRLRLLAVTSANRSPLAPDAPTIAEAGYAGYEVLGWQGIHVPKGTPRAVITRINQGIRETLKLPDTRERVLNAGLESIGNTPEEFDAFVKKDAARWTQLIHQAGIRLE